MAEPKKKFEKTKRSSKSSATTKPGDEMIEGAAVEKLAAAQSDRLVKDQAKSQGQPSISKDSRLSAILTSKSATVFMAGFAIVLALIALMVSVVPHKQTADETIPGQPAVSTVFTGVDQADLDVLSQRLESLVASVAQNEVQITTLQQELVGVTEKRSTDTSAITNLDDVIARLSALEAADADQTLVTTVTNEPTAQGGFDTAQIGLLVAVGLLAENLAGRDIELWVNVLDDLQWLGVDVADRDIIRGAARKPVDSRADLLTLGRLQLAQMVKGLNKADEGSGLLEKTRARLANLIQLRRTGGDSDQPETVIASFESALDNANFDAAFAAAIIWSSAGLDGLQSWLPAAQRRHDLDQAVNRLVATFVQHAVGQN